MIFAAAIVGFASCSLLDKEPLSDLSPEAYFTTETDLQMFSNTFYNNLLDKSYYGHQSDAYIKLTLSDELHGGTYRTVPASGGGWSWGDLRKMNTLLANIGNCEDEGARLEYEALTRFFRAFFYFEKVMRFGDVPWIDVELGSADEQLYAPRNNREFILQKMLADIDFAIEHLPSAVSTFRVNKWAACALKAQFCLFEGTFRKYHNYTVTPDVAGVEAVNDYKFYLQQAAAAAKAVIDSNVYSLYTTGKPNEDYMMLFAQEDASKQEYILALSFNYAAAIFNGSTAYGLLSSLGHIGVTKKIVNQYLMADGSRFTDKAGYETMEFYDEMQNRDPRLSQSVRTPGYKRIDGDKVLAPDFSACCTGYQTIKFVMSAKANGGDSDRVDRSTNDLPVYRYAEVLLNYAEAKAELNDLSQADLDMSVNKLRKRVGMPDMKLGATVDPYLTNPKTGYSNPILLNDPNLAMILEVRRERVVELAQESKYRWNDLRRWKEGKCIDQDMHGMYFPGPGDYDLDKNGTIDVCLYEGEKPNTTATSTLKIGTDINLSAGNKGYVVPPVGQHTFDESRDYLYPIPINERSLNQNLTQNPNWNDGLDF